MGLKLNLLAHLLHGRCKVEDCPYQPSAKRPSNPCRRHYGQCDDPDRKEQNPSRECLLKSQGDRFHARFVHEGFGLNKPPVSDNSSKKRELVAAVFDQPRGCRQETHRPQNRQPQDSAESSPKRERLSAASRCHSNLRSMGQNAIDKAPDAAL